MAAEGAAPEGTVVPIDWRNRLPEEYPDYLDFFPVEGRGIGCFVLRDFQPGETVLEEKPIYVRPLLEVLRRVWTDEWEKEYARIRATLAFPGNSQAEVKLTPSQNMVRNAIGYAKSSQWVQQEILKLWHPAPDSEHPLVGIAQELAALCVVHIEECRALEVGELRRAILALEMNMFAGGLVFQLFSRVNHSCYPNVVFTAAKDEWKLKALRPIQHGDELTHAYLGEGLLMPTELRRWQLWRSKCFHCICERCLARVDPLRVVPCRFCAEEVRRLCSKRWRVIHKPGVWHRQTPATTGGQIGFFKTGSTVKTTGRFSGLWVEVECDDGGWVLTNGAEVGLGELLRVEESQPAPKRYIPWQPWDTWASYGKVFFRNAYASEPRLPESVDVSVVEELELPECYVTDPTSTDIAYAQFEVDHWHCSKCGRDDRSEALLNLEIVLSRLAERTFYSPQIIRTEGFMKIDNSSKLAMVNADFLSNAILLAEVVSSTLGHRHWTAQWARILFTDICGSLREFGHNPHPMHSDPLRDVCLLWDWIDSLQLAQSTGCWLFARAERFLSEASCTFADDEARAWSEGLCRRCGNEPPLVNMLALRNYVLEGSVTFG